MKINLRSVSLGSLAAITLLVAPLVASKIVRANDGGGRRGEHLEQLNLSEEQSTQIEAIRANARSQKEALLTTEQRATLESEGRRGWRGLDLTEQQRSQMDTIRDTYRAETDAVLTAEQRQQRDEQRAEHQAKRGDRTGGRRGGQRWEALNLSETQTAEIEAIRTDSRSQMQALLTAEQRASVEAEGEGRRAWRGLDLTEAQRSQMDAIREASKSRMEAVLTPEQQQQLEQMQQEHGERHGGRRNRSEGTQSRRGSGERLARNSRTAQ